MSSGIFLNKNDLILVGGERNGRRMGGELGWSLGFRVSGLE